MAHSPARPHRKNHRPNNNNNNNNNTNNNRKYQFKQQRSKRMPNYARHIGREIRANPNRPQLFIVNEAKSILLLAIKSSRIGDYKNKQVGFYANSAPFFFCSALSLMFHQVDFFWFLSRLLPVKEPNRKFIKSLLHSKFDTVELRIEAQ